MSAEIRCPSCGSTELREVSLGQYECLGQIAIRKPLPSSVQGVPEPPPEYRPCKERFAVGPIPTCEVKSCEEVAAGICVVCRRPACAAHRGSHKEEPFTCRPCIEQIAEEKREAQQECERSKHEEAVLRPLFEINDPQEIAEHLVANREAFHQGDPGLIWAHLMALQQVPPTHELVELMGKPSFLSSARGIWTATETRSPLWVAPEGFTDPYSRRSPQPKLPTAIDAAGNFTVLRGPCMLPKPTEETHQSVVLPMNKHPRLHRDIDGLTKVWLVRNGYFAEEPRYFDRHDHVLTIVAIAEGSSGP